MNLLALDQSSRASGYSVFKDSNLIASGTFTADNPDFGQRLVKIRNVIKNLIDEYEINEIAFEDIQLQAGNVTTYKALAEVLGVVQELSQELLIPYTIVHSQTWKSYLEIKGTTRTEQKKNAQKFVAETYDKKVSQDESDSICIGHYISHTKKESAF